MDDVVNNIKSKFSTDNLIDMMKEAKVIDANTEEDVRRTLEKVDFPNSVIDAEELAEKLSMITEEAKQANASKPTTISDVTDKMKSSVINVLNKTVITKNEKEKEESNIYMINDNITAFID